MTLLGTHAADFLALLIDYREKINVMKKTTNAESLASIMQKTEKDIDALKTSKDLHAEVATKLRALYIEQVGAPTVPSAFIARSGEWGHFGYF
jgi:hypothetical protein